MEPRVARVIEEMQRRLEAPWTVHALASLAELSTSRFTYLFRRDTGFTPIGYLHQLRMARASLLLERTSLSIHDVMMQVGYRDPSHFARDFRRRHHYSPREYRFYRSRMVLNRSGQ